MPTALQVYPTNGKRDGFIHSSNTQQVVSFRYGGGGGWFNPISPVKRNSFKSSLRQWRRCATFIVHWWVCFSEHPADTSVLTLLSLDGLNNERCLKILLRPKKCMQFKRCSLPAFSSIYTLIHSFEIVWHCILETTIQTEQSLLQLAWWDCMPTTFEPW